MKSDVKPQPRTGRMEARVHECMRSKGGSIATITHQEVWQREKNILSLLQLSIYDS